MGLSQFGVEPLYEVPAVGWQHALQRVLECIERDAVAPLDFDEDRVVVVARL